LATVLVMLLGFIGTMVFSHIPITVMANEDQQIERSVNMTAFESNNKNAVEVDGIRFETIVPERSYRLPQYGEETPIQFGVRITNQTSTPYRFDLQRFLPEILDPQGNNLQMDGGQNSTRLVEESDIPLLMPGESLDFLIDAKLNWYKKKCVSISGRATYGGFWIFWNIKPGEYQLRLKYENQLFQMNRLMSAKGWTEIDEFWIGSIKTPLAALRFR
jgi:hypothetical protein